MSAGKTMNEMKAWQEIFDKERAQQRKWIQHAFDEYKKSGQKIESRYKFDGRGSTMWIGLNADPCKAKYLAKLDPGATERPDPTEPNPPPKSSSTRFLEQVGLASAGLFNLFLQRFGLSPSPYCEFSSKKVPRPELIETESPHRIAEELLVHGVSRVEEGRRGYLQYRKLTEPQQRFAGGPVTSAMEIGWTVEKEREPRPKKNLSAGAPGGNARGTMKATFYRPKVAGHGIHRREDDGALEAS
ncbi:hypothetical protein FOL47_010951 [Perkinsus chesapeaki]|uniref:Sperm microtubule inner protein 1 C-terminal domain-containing protein n=1 Tax=Perkinsus chesapeaki TaxID=330153 RepID=A0A7J6N2P5_PERCH|nr:hypothetical protein FOL47_010951 [Perkinsus chesapeaki]